MWIADRSLPFHRAESGRARGRMGCSRLSTSGDCCRHRAARAAPAVTGTAGRLSAVPDTARFHTPAPPPGLGSALGKQGRFALAPVPWPPNQCPHSPRVPEPSTKRHSPLLLTFRELPAAALFLEVPCSPSCVNDYALVYLPHGRAA
ncbi:hypothetical protein E5288_WYG008428 [Bos mutus]|uniref:Uncharacterized protein n=1 Tax=Bos mutus TaxID=72004 RepID=A0A6B0RZ37_9CETA|nr:hypothetical protein [Bos mutus]